MKLIDVITLTATASLFAAVTVANIIQPSRPTESKTEQRPLADIPAFSVEALADGSYFKDWSAFFSDTFLGRDALVDLSKEFDAMMGIPYDIGDGNHFAILRPDATVEGDEPDENDENILAGAFGQLGKDETETTPPDTEPPETDAPDTEPLTLELVLSKDALSLTPGSGAVVTASVKTSDGTKVHVSWSISDEAVATVANNPDGGVDVKAVAAGTCTLTCTAGGGVSAVCEITVTEPEHEVNTNTDTPDFINGGFIYGDAVYIQAYYGAKSANYYAQTAEYYQALFGEDVQVSVIVAPVSAMVLDTPEVTSLINNQAAVYQKWASLFDTSKVNYVDVYSELYAHKDEYLFYKSDHHWTGLGAYYAYRAFAASRGFTPTALEDFDYRALTDTYNGSMYALTKDIRVKEFLDSVEVWMSKKKMTMTVTTPSGQTGTYSHAILTGNKNYITFIAGDNPYTVINVPENPQDRNILVLKDSFGNAFIPYLAEHYGNIIIVDPRYTSVNLYEQLRDYSLSDILFINNAQLAVNSNWPKMFLGLVGVTE